MPTGKKITDLTLKASVRDTDLFIVADITDLVSYSVTFATIKANVISNIDFAKYDSNYTTTNTYSASWNGVIASTVGLFYGTLSLSGNVYAAYAGPSYMVGIGTITPNEKLTVVGNISATGNINAGTISSVGNINIGLKGYAGVGTVDTDTDLTLATKGFVNSHTYLNSSVIQTVYTTMATVSSNLKGKIPLDGTTPQITEGLKVLQTEITPTSASNAVEVSVSLNCTYNSGTANPIAIAVFRNAEPNAIFASYGDYGGYQGIRTISFIDTPNTTSPVIYSVRVGGYTTTEGFNINKDGVYDTNYGSATFSWIKLVEMRNITFSSQTLPLP